MTITRKHRMNNAAPLFSGQSAQPAQIDDFVDDVLCVVRRLVPGMQPEHCAAASKLIRSRWGGDRPYIAHRQGEGRDDAIRTDYLAGVKLDAMVIRYGLTQRRILQIVKSW